MAALEAFFRLLTATATPERPRVPQELWTVVSK